MPNLIAAVLGLLVWFYVIRFAWYQSLELEYTEALGCATAGTASAFVLGGIVYALTYFILS